MKTLFKIKLTLLKISFSILIFKSPEFAHAEVVLALGQKTSSDMSEFVCIAGNTYNPYWNVAKYFNVIQIEKSLSEILPELNNGIKIKDAYNNSFYSKDQLFLEFFSGGGTIGYDRRGIPWTSLEVKSVQFVTSDIQTSSKFVPLDPVVYMEQKKMTGIEFDSIDKKQIIGSSSSQFGGFISTSRGHCFESRLYSLGTKGTLFSMKGSNSLFYSHGIMRSSKATPSAMIGNLYREYVLDDYNSEDTLPSEKYFFDSLIMYGKNKASILVTNIESEESFSISGDRIEDVRLLFGNDSISNVIYHDFKKNDNLLKSKQKKFSSATMESFSEAKCSPYSEPTKFSMQILRNDQSYNMDAGLFIKYKLESQEYPSLDSEESWKKLVLSEVLKLSNSKLRNHENDIYIINENYFVVKNSIFHMKPKFICKFKKPLKINTN